MTSNKLSRVLCLLLSMPVVILLFPLEGYGVPAAPLDHELIQSDGSKFMARQWGDESLHGWETQDGDTIVYDSTLQNWTYADQDNDGHLISTSKIIGMHQNPSHIKKHLRPSGKALSDKPMMTTTKERHPAVHSYQAGEQFSSAVNQVIMPENGVGIQSDQVSGLSDPQYVVPSDGIGRIPMILMNFNNTATTYSATDFNSLLFGNGNKSVNDYYKEVSYGEFSIAGQVLGWYTSSQGHDYYGADVGGTSGNDSFPGTLVREAVAAVEAANPSFDWSPYDTDGDCYVDVVMIVHQGRGQEESGKATDIWSNRWDLNSAYYYGSSNGGEYTTHTACSTGGYIRVNDYTLEPEQLGGNMSTIGVYAHEYGHALGLPDLYDTDGSSNGVGDWSLMASGNWNYVGNFGDSPAHLDAWSKYRLGWIAPLSIQGTQNVSLNQASASNANYYQILVGTPTSGEYFLLENRQKSGFDSGLPGAGMLIWHIDGSTISSQSTFNTVNNAECYSGGPSCAVQHYGVALEQADGNWNLEKGNNRGDAGDPFPGTSGNTAFSATSTPNSILYNGQPSNITVSSISNSGSIMTATVSTPINAGALSVTPANGLTSTGTQGGPFAPSNVIYTLQNTGGASINWTAGKTQTWVTLSSAGGTLASGASTTVTVSINSTANSLAAGGYSDTVSFTNATNGGGDTSRAVTLTVNPTSGALSVTPANGLTSSGTQGGPFAPSNVIYTLQNTGGASINWTAGKTQTWVTLSSAGGTLASGASTTVTVSINSTANSLAAGGYSDMVSFTNATNGGGDTSRAVTLTVNPTSGALSVTPAEGLTSSGTQGGPFTPSNVIYTLRNTGGASINWTAGKTQTWVTLSSAGGILASGASTTVTVSINSAANSLAAGGYSDMVSFTNATNGGGNATRAVSFSISFAGVSDGDLDGGGVTIADALLALRIAAGVMTPTASDLIHGDVAPLVSGKPQPDGRIDIGDVVVILRKAVGLTSWQ